MKKLILLLGALGCASPGEGNRGFEIQRMSGQTPEYIIDVLEYFSNGFCMTREMTLHETNGLHIDPNHVSHVRATDRNCDDSFESFYFRDNRDQQVNRNILEGDLLNMYYNLRMER